MKLWKSFFISLIGGAILGLIIALLIPGGFVWRAWTAAGVLSWISLFILLNAWRLAKGTKTLAWIMALAFIIRLAGGIAISLVLQNNGYDTDQQQAGYVFNDAFRRDVESWGLVESGEKLWDVFWVGFDTDQYGGLLVSSTVVYRYLSPDMHRPFLILILSACAASLAVAFFWYTLKERWNIRLANLAAWFLALYPDSILFGASQMREPFLIALSAIAFWAVVCWHKHKWQSLIAFLLSTFLMVFLSPLIAAVYIVFLIVWFWVENLIPRSRLWLIIGLVLMTLVVIGVIVFGWDWFKNSTEWDMLLTERNSGWVQKIVEQVGEQWRLPFITVYGVAQPVLPAAIAEPTIPVWKVIAILRALGWYAMAPLLIYSVFIVWKEKDKKERNAFLWTICFMVLWLFISSARAGGDQWDNPRYRIEFILWYSLLSAWAILWAKDHRDAWLVRWIIVECIFLGFFTNWYFSRYFNWWNRLPFWKNVLWIIVLSGLVIGGGFLWDFTRTRITKTNQEGVDNSIKRK